MKMLTNYTYAGVNNTIQRLVVVSPSWLTTGRIQIPLYTTILLLAVTGNALVILTLVQNRRMRTITNVFLLNLAVSDILLGVLCMPFTLIGTLLRDFVFGEIMCKFLPYLQGKRFLCLFILNWIIGWFYEETCADISSIGDGVSKISATPALQ